MKKVHAILPVKRIRFDGKLAITDHEVYEQEIEFDQDPLLLERLHPVFGYWRGITSARSWSADRTKVTFHPITVLYSESVDFTKFGWKKWN